MLRTFARRLSIWAVLAAALSALLVGVSPDAAQAQPSSNHVRAQAKPSLNHVQEVDWDVTHLTATTRDERAAAAAAYTGMVLGVRQDVAHAYAYRVDETTEVGNQIIQINIMRGGLLVTRMYLWARSLYVIGFWDPHGGTYLFNDPGNSAAWGILGVAQANRHWLPWNGNYATTPGGGERATLTYGPQRIANAVFAVGVIPAALNGSNQQRQNLGVQMIRMVQIVAEAARFDTIRILINHNLRYGTANGMGAANLELQNSWGRISDFIHHIINAGWAPAITLNHRQYHTLNALMEYLIFVTIRNPNVAGGS